jgi:hypothetical protein
LALSRSFIYPPNNTMSIEVQIALENARVARAELMVTMLNRDLTEAELYEYLDVHGPTTLHDPHCPDFGCVPRTLLQAAIWSHRPRSALLIAKSVKSKHLNLGYVGKHPNCPGVLPSRTALEVATKFADETGDKLWLRVARVLAGAPKMRPVAVKIAPIATKIENLSQDVAECKIVQPKME